MAAWGRPPAPNPILLSRAMNSSRSLLLSVAAACIALLSASLYLQLAGNMSACPHCIVQRWLLAALALMCVAASCLPARLRKSGAGVALLVALAGIGAALWHLWVQNQPASLCGAGVPGEAPGAMPAAGLLPSLSLADDSCLAAAALLGLSIPQWSLLAFSLAALALVRYIAQPEPLVPWLP